MDDSTRLIRSATRRSSQRRGVNPPIERATTVLMPTAAELFDERPGPVYGISGLQAQQALAKALAELERAERVFLAPTGLAAVTMPLLALLRAGDEVLVTDAVYGPSRRFCERFLKRYGVGARFYPPRATAEELLRLATEKTRLILLESPGSLTFEIQDVPAIAAAARERGVLTLIDNTWAAGLLFKPLEHGIDISIQALSKYVGGHSDVFGGSVAVRDARLAREIAAGADDMGWYVSPDDAWLMLRGLRTLPTRLNRHGESALEVAKWLLAQPEALQVLHPALPQGSDHVLWSRDFSGANGLLGFVLDGDHPRALRLLDALELFGIGVSWGGFESLAVPCRDMLLRRAHKPEFDGELIRLHIGLEDPQDLIADLRQALVRSA
ncbi:MAG TPA: cystathionine beta-lyase [Caulobacteraceae bacterium]|jgi:cystathionine beta-lyase